MELNETENGQSSRNPLQIEEARLNKLLTEEHLPCEQRIHVKVYLSSHGSSRDYAEDWKIFQQADIVIDEAVGWDSEYVANIQKVVDGEVSPEQELARDGILPDSPKYQKYLAKLNSIFNIQKPFGYIDLPSDHPLNEKMENLIISFAITANLYFLTPSEEKTHDGFMKVLNEWDRYIKEVSDIQMQREKYMLAQLKPTISKIINSNSTLKEKEDLEVLISIGAQHTGIYHKLKEEHPDLTDWEFDPFPYIFDFETEASRAYMFGKEVNEMLLARSLLQRVLQNTLDISSLSNEEFTKSLRIILSEFSIDDIEEIFKQANGRKEVPTNLHKAIKAKGLDKQLDDFPFLDLLAE